MADFIDRDAEIKRLENLYCVNCTKRGKYPMYGAYCKTCWTLDAIEAIEDAPFVNRWIPCSERMPERGAKPIVFLLKTGEDTVYPYIGFYNYPYGGWQESSTGNIYRECDVEYWIPLPDPPKEE